MIEERIDELIEMYKSFIESLEYAKAGERK